MKAEPRTILERRMREVGISQAELARRLDTSKQQIGRFQSGERKISPQWARKIAPILGLDWPALIEGGPTHEVPASVKPGVVVGDARPLDGEPPYDLDEKALIKFWRGLRSITKRAAVFDRLGLDEMPSLSRKEN